MGRGRASGPILPGFGFYIPPIDRQRAGTPGGAVVGAAGCCLNTTHIHLCTKMGSRAALATLVALVLATTKADEASSAAARAAALRRKGLELYAPQHQIEIGTLSIGNEHETARLLEAKTWFEKAVEADPSDATNHA